jgi:hypothetical protein
MVPETEPDRQVMRREGEFWTIVFAGETCRLRDTVGLRYLSHLLVRPHEEVDALELRGVVAHEGSDDRPLATNEKSRERARVNVTRALRAVLERLRTHHVPLFEHLSATLRTGAHCAYRPDPRIATRWE